MTVEEQSYAGGPGPAAGKRLRAGDGGQSGLRDSLVNQAKLDELLRTQVPHMKRYSVQRKKCWGKGRGLKEITAKIHRSFHGGFCHV